MQQVSARLVNKTSTLAFAVGSTSPVGLSIGKTSVADKVTVSLALTGCGSTFTMEASFFANGTTLTAQVSSSIGATVDGPQQFFSEYVDFFFLAGLDGGASVAIRADVNAPR